MKKEEADRIYKKLREEYTDEEIADSFVFSIDMTDEERKQLQIEINTRRNSMTDIDKERVKKFVEKLRKEDGSKYSK